MGNRIIHLVRHGQYDIATPDDEEPDGRLTQLGKEQAEMTAAYLSTHPIRVIHYSTLTRAQETAVIIAPYFPLARMKPDAQLRECIPSVPAGYEMHFQHIPKRSIKSGPGRAKKAFKAYFKPIAKEAPDVHELIASHGNLINYFIARSILAPADSWMNLGIHHCSISQVVVLPSGRIRLVHFNETGHLPQSHKTI